MSSFSKIKITRENINDLIDEFGDEWMTTRAISEMFEINLGSLRRWVTKGFVRRIEGSTKSAPCLANVGDAILRQHQARKQKPFLRKMVDGKLVCRCGVCEQWKSSEEFYPDKSQSHGLTTSCIECHKLRRKIRYQSNRDREISRRKERYAMHKKMARAASSWKPSNMTPAAPILEVVLRVCPDMTNREIEQTYDLPDDSIRSLRRVAEKGSLIKVSTADQILNALDMPEEFARIVDAQMEAPRWSKSHDYCVRCMRVNIPHEAGGFCRTCYRHRNDHDWIPPSENKWSLRHSRCICCHTTDRPHSARGMCKSCYDKARRAADKVGSEHGNLRQA
jgi:hypothetical protein